MTIEVRQLLIRTQVGLRPSVPAPGAAAPGAAASARELERAKAQILAECKAWLREQLREARER